MRDRRHNRKPRQSTTPGENDPHPPGPPGPGSSNLPIGASEYFPSKTAFLQLTQKTTDAARAEDEHNLHADVLPFVHRAKEQLPELYAAAFRMWQEVATANSGHWYRGRESTDGMQGDELLRESFLRIVRSGQDLNFYMQTFAGTEELAKFKHWLSNDGEFIEEFGKRKKQAAKEAANPPRVTDNDYLLFLWWHGGFWMMSETSAANMALHLFKRSISNESIKVMANKKGLPQCTSRRMGKERTQKPLVSVSEAGKIEGFGIFSGGA